MLNTLWLLIVKNWKTTATGLSSMLIWILKFLGINIPDETALALTGFLVSLGLIFAKDGNRTGLIE